MIVGSRPVLAVGLLVQGVLGQRAVPLDAGLIAQQKRPNWLESVPTQDYEKLLQDDSVQPQDGVSDFRLDFSKLDDDNDGWDNSVPWPGTVIDCATEEGIGFFPMTRHDLLFYDVTADPDPMLPCTHLFGNDCRQAFHKTIQNRGNTHLTNLTVEVRCCHRAPPSMLAFECTHSFESIKTSPPQPCSALHTCASDARSSNSSGPRPAPPPCRFDTTTMRRDCHGHRGCASRRLTTTPASATPGSARSRPGASHP